MSSTSKNIYSLSRLEKTMRKLYGSYGHYFKGVEFPNFKDFQLYFGNNRKAKTFSLDDGVQFLSVYLSSKGIKQSNQRERAILLILKKSSKPPKHFPVISKAQKKLKLQNENFKKRDMNGLLGKAEIRPKDYTDKNWGNYSVRPVKKR